MKSKPYFEEIFHSLVDYFTFSRLHRRGSLVLLFIIAILCAGFYFINFVGPDEKFDPAPFENELKLFEEALSKSASAKGQAEDNKAVFSEKQPAIEKKESLLFPFNPNDLNEEGFVQLGLSLKQAAVITRYRAKGGKFRKKEDLKKMYCISSTEYERMEPFIIIPEDTTEYRQFNSSSKSLAEKTITSEIYELNSANQTELDSIRGIGPATASAIIKYREKLGGYISIEQLREVYGIDSIVYEKVKERLKVETSVPSRININKGFEDDLKHPYMNRNLAKLIINYRKLHGPFKSVDELRKLALVNDELYVKLAPYLSTE